MKPLPDITGKHQDRFDATAVKVFDHFDELARGSYIAGCDQVEKLTVALDALKHQ